MKLKFEAFISGEEKIAIVGLGYVGLPLAVHLSRHFKVVGYDLKKKRINELKACHDCTLEVDENDLKVSDIDFTSDAKNISKCRLIIVAVPTPIDESRIPDLTPVRNSSMSVGKYLSPGSCVVFESTVYPGVTEEICVPILEKESGLKFGTDFTVGYSPERINPGDKVHTLENIIKIVSGSDSETLNFLVKIYAKVVHAGIHKASSIKVAEAAKVIENTQRDINIALMNELAMIFDLIGINTREVLEAAGTKWNFLKFEPGLVGGHCLAKDQLIFAKRDEKLENLTIKDLYGLYGKRASDGINSVKKPENLEILSYDLESKKALFKNVDVLTKRKYSNVIKFTTSTNQIIKVSDDHPMIVYESGKFNVKLAKDVNLSDRFAVNTKLPELEFKKEIDLIELLDEKILENVRIKPISKNLRDYKNEMAIKKNTGNKASNFYENNYLPLEVYLELEAKGIMPVKRDEVYLSTGRGSSYNQIEAIINIDEDFSRLIGYYLSEGCITKDKSLTTRWTFNSLEADYIEDVCQCIKKLGSSYSVFHSKTDKASHIKLSSNIFGALLLNILKCGKNSYDASVPDFLLYSSKAIKENLLMGLFRGNGEVKLSINDSKAYVKNGKTYTHKNCSCEITYFSISKKLFHQVVLLLCDYGITMSFDRERPLLYIHGHENISKFKNIFIGDKHEKIRQYFDNKVKFVKSNKYEIFDEFLVVDLKEIEKIEDDYVYSLEVSDTETIISDYGMILHNCIGVDPYYLTFKAEAIGYHPEMILAGRRINDQMGKYIAERTVKMLIASGKPVLGAKIAVLGLSFKENVPDLRNTRVVDIIDELKDYGLEVLVNDPYADPVEARSYYGLDLHDLDEIKNVDAVIIAVIHNNYLKAGLKNILSLCSNKHPLIIDVKGAFNHDEAERLNINYWTL
ncbi:UDP-N-acetyl-D-galactosamine dehydrogenase [Candidatus Magnetomoraceae bacterium gMMP-13]